MNVYERTLGETIEFLKLVIDTTDESIKDGQRRKAKALKIEYETRLSNIEELKKCYSKISQKNEYERTGTGTKREIMEAMRKINKIFIDIIVGAGIVAAYILVTTRCS